MPGKSGFFSTLARWLGKIEDTLLAGLLLTMIGMAVTQITLRNLFDSGIVWGDSLVRVLVLWIGLVGAMAATRTDNHIRIDMISRYLPDQVKPYTTLAVHGFTALVTAAMAWFSLRFVRMEMADNLMAFGRVPAWVCELIIPIAFGVISLRYTLFSIMGLIRWVSPRP